MKNQRKSNTWLLVLVVFVLVIQACSAGEKREMQETAQAEDALTINATLEVGPTQISPKDGMEMVYVQEGEFFMGAKVAETRVTDWERPYHLVRLDSYWIDKTEASNAMFAAFVEESGYVTDAEKAGWGYVWTEDGRKEMEGAYWMNPRGPGSSIDGIEDHPVMLVSWNDAAAYCEWAGRRLPTEAEWEKAARGIDGRFYPWGNEWDSSLANADDEEVFDETTVKCSPAGCDGFDITAPVDTYVNGASPYGVLSMAGNLLEWNADYYMDFYYKEAPSDNPRGPAEGDRHVLRGGSWFNDEWSLRTTRRYGQEPDYRSDKLGFRCAASDMP